MRKLLNASLFVITFAVGMIGHMLILDYAEVKTLTELDECLDMAFTGLNPLGGMGCMQDYQKNVMSTKRNFGIAKTLEYKQLKFKK